MIAAIVCYCTNEYRFAKHCIDSLASLDQIIVTACDCFCDGSPENMELIDRTEKENPTAQFVRFKYNKKVDMSKAMSGYYIRYSRFVGIQYVKPEIDYVLFIDIDEIFEKDRLAAWIDRFPYHEFDSIKFANYWYMRSPRIRCTRVEDSVVLARKSLVWYENVLVTQGDRTGLWIGNNKIRMVVDKDGEPMIHHYSWVRTKEEMLKKAATWGHKKDQNWVKLINKEFEHPPRTKDLIFKREYEEVNPYITFDDIE